MSSTPHVELRSVGKRFGATVAVRDVDLAIHGGQVHALVGENGAGKSTLGKLIAGVHTPDEGEILLAGSPVHFRSPRQALEHGVTIVAQELSLVPARTVEENVFLGQEPHQGPLVSRRALRQRFDDLADRSGIEVRPDAVVARSLCGRTAEGRDPARLGARGRADRDGRTDSATDRTPGGGVRPHDSSTRRRWHDDRAGLAFPGGGVGGLRHRHCDARRSTWYALAQQPTRRSQASSKP